MQVGEVETIHCRIRCSRSGIYLGCCGCANGRRISPGTTVQCIVAKAATQRIVRRTGAFGTVHAGQTVFVESMAAGAAGDFFDLVQKADAVGRLGRPVSPHEFKLIFLPWQLRQQYRADPATVR